MSETIIRLLGSAQRPEVLAAEAVLLPGLGLICLLQWRLLVWKRRWRELGSRNGLLQERLDLERRHAQEKMALLEKAGRGNLLSQAGKFPELGVKVRTEIARTFEQDIETDQPPAKN
jgi:hypothetical protein